MQYCCRSLVWAMNRSIEEVQLHSFLDYSSWLRKSLELADFGCYVVALLQNLAKDHNFVLRFLAVVESLFDSIDREARLIFYRKQIIVEHSIGKVGRKLE